MLLCFAVSLFRVYAERNTRVGSSVEEAFAHVGSTETWNSHIVVTLAVELVVVR